MDDADDLDQYFSQVVRDQEVERVLAAFKRAVEHDADRVPEETGTAQTKRPVCPVAESLRNFRSLCQLHAERHQEAVPEEVSPFASRQMQTPEGGGSLCDAAESDLHDEEKRSALNATISEARAHLIKKRKLSANDPVLDTQEFEDEVMAQTKSILIEDELRRRRQLQAKLREEGEEARKNEEMMKERKRKMEERQNWEQGREQRVSNWRDFNAKSRGGKKLKGSTFKPPKLKTEDSGKPYIQRKANDA
ncbi:MAG: hypothetical protein BJ554DRAFT_5185 [Olpidium bornovanus]|uniref:Uncharacterized protein n=1 Tax=Olpidium bornovanus TaxID=278681 RepID=A0A8H8DDJ2_9FUNG|nr:MAG: hypothetical protein BJ554DRAFT_5185 [Olpidium bornovanus]